MSTSRKSPVWNFFDLEDEGIFAICMKEDCGEKIRYRTAKTKKPRCENMWKHIRQCWDYDEKPEEIWLQVNEKYHPPTDPTMIEFSSEDDSESEDSDSEDEMKPTGMVKEIPSTSVAALAELQAYQKTTENQPIINFSLAQGIQEIWLAYAELKKEVNFNVINVANIPGAFTLGTMRYSSWKDQLQRLRQGLDSTLEDLMTEGWKLDVDMKAILEAQGNYLKREMEGLRRFLDKKNKAYRDSESTTLGTFITPTPKPAKPMPAVDDLMNITSNLNI